jgi:hypothetical protein
MHCASHDGSRNYTVHTDLNQEWHFFGLLVRIHQAHVLQQAKAMACMWIVWVGVGQISSLLQPHQQIIVQAQSCILFKESFLGRI